MKYSILYLWLVLLISFSYLQSCTYDKGEIPAPVQTAPYQTTVKPIIQTYCYGQGAQSCHVTNSNQGASGDFTTYEGLKEKVDNGSFENRVFTLHDMPPAYSTSPTALAPEDFAKLKTWVNNGALNN
ncbi:MAG: hypothetical protein V4608_10105 [Bacteroidota bacterium]